MLRRSLRFRNLWLDNIRDSLQEMAVKKGKMIRGITQILEGMQDFCRSKKNMFLFIRETITAVERELGRLHRCYVSHKSFLSSRERGMPDHPGFKSQRR